MNKKGPYVTHKAVIVKSIQACKVLSGNLGSVTG